MLYLLSFDWQKVLPLLTIVTTLGAQLVISNAAMLRTKNSNFFMTVCNNLFKRKDKAFL